MPVLKIKGYQHLW